MTVNALVWFGARWCHWDTTPWLLNFFRGLMGCVELLLIASEPSLLEWVVTKNTANLSTFLATTDLILILVLKPLDLVHLLCPLGDDLTLLADAHLIQVCWAEAKLFVKMSGEEACGTHMISCLFMVPVFLMVLIFYRHLSYIIFLLEIFHFGAPSNFS